MWEGAEPRNGAVLKTATVQVDFMINHIGDLAESSQSTSYSNYCESRPQVAKNV